MSLFYSEDVEELQDRVKELEQENMHLSKEGASLSG